MYSTKLKLVFACLVVLCIVFFAQAATNPAFIDPTPANESFVAGVQNFNFTFEGLVNWTLVGDGGLGALCAANNSASPQNCTWNTSTASELTYNFTLNTTNTSNEGDSALLLWQLTVDNTAPVFAEINITPSSTNNFTNQTPVISVLVTETNLDVCEYQNGNGTWVALTQNNLGGSYLCTGQVGALPSFPQPVLNFTFRANDTAGNVVAEQPVNLTVDQFPPNLTFVSPADGLGVSDGSNFTVTVTVIENSPGFVASGFTDGAACNVTINDLNVLTGSVTYNSTSGQCNGTVFIDDPSGITAFPAELGVRFTDRVNNSAFANQTLDLDNVAPVFITAQTNESGNVVGSLTQLFTIIVRTFDESAITRVTASNASLINLTQTGGSNPSTADWGSAVNASRLGCAADGCVVNVTANDTWGQLSSTSFILYVDDDTPQYTNAAINETVVGLRQPTLISALWSDDSLNSSSLSTAQLQKLIDGTYTSILNISLSSSLQWSNFTYIPFPADDEGANVSLRILYEDFLGRSNTTPAFPLIVSNVSPVILSLDVLDRTGSVSNETPTFSIRYADDGSGLTDANVVLNITGPENRTVTKSTSWSCVDETAFNTSFLAENAWINFTTSSYGATNYSFRITDIGNASSSTDTDVTLERFLYGRTSQVELESWGDSFDYEDIRVTLINSTDFAPDRVAFGFTELGYTEQSCNFTLTNFPEGEYNATVRLTDGVNNTNTSGVFTWTVDGSRPTFLNVTADSSFVFFNGSRVNDSVNVTVSGNVTVNWSINDSSLNTTQVTSYGSVRQVFSDSSGVASNSTSFDLRPGHHLLSVSASDVIGAEFNTTIFFDVFVNSFANMTAIREEMLVASNGLTFDYWNFTLNGSDITADENARLNESVGFNLSFNRSTTNFTYVIAPLDGTTYNWDNVFGLNYSDENISPQTGIVADMFIVPDGYHRQELSDLVNGSYFESSFLPSNESRPTTNMTFNKSDDFFIVLRELTTPTYHLLEECSSTEVASYSDACYTNTSTEYTVYAPELAGLAFGRDAGAPNISVTLPSTPVNDSEFSVFLEVIEPSPNSTLFCNYSMLFNGTTVDSFLLNTSNFTLNQSRYTMSFPYVQFNDSDLYEVNVTCFDDNGLSTFLSTPFEVEDNTPPQVLSVVLNNSFPTSVDFNIELNEFARARLNLSTSVAGLSSQTNFTDFGRNVTFSATGLNDDDNYLYVVEACDLNNQCSLFPTSGNLIHRTPEASPSRSGGGGGGGGLVSEGSIIASHFHGWSELEAGWLRYGVGEDEIAVTSINVLLENRTLDPFVQIFVYQGKAPNIPAADSIAYQYFRLEHQGLIGSEFELEFSVPESWLRERESSPQQVGLYRLEQGAWVEYAVSVRPSIEGNAQFVAELPGFSYFVIRADGVEPVLAEPVENVTVEEPVVAPPVVDEPIVDEPEPEVVDSGGTVVGYEEPEGGAWWWWLVGIILVLVAVSGGAWYVLSHRPVAEQKTVLDPNDPFYKLQQYILHALENGHSRDEIREKLVSVGWDEIVVDEEIEGIMTRRV